MGGQGWLMGWDGSWQCKAGGWQSFGVLAQLWLGAGWWVGRAALLAGLESRSAPGGSKSRRAGVLFIASWCCLALLLASGLLPKRAESFLLLWVQ